jgi:ABC-2 type transport system permease protein
VTTTATASDLRSRPVPRLGGFSPILLTLEVRRLLRNRRTLIFTMIMPSVFFLLFGLRHSYSNQPAGHGNVAAFILISMALYGAVLATTSGGAMISIERSLGWSRQLRLTPLSAPAYIATKMATSMVLGFFSVLVVYLVGAFTRQASMPVYLVFAAFGLFMGYLLPTENVMQFMGFILMLLAFGGGLFIPLSTYPHLLQALARFTPLYGLNQLVHVPLTGGAVNLWWAVNVVAWLIIFAGGAVWRFRQDTARV